MVAPDDLLRGVHEHRLAAPPAPSFTPPREPGRLTTRQSPTTPASPRDSAAVGTPLRDAVRADRLGDARAPRGRAARRVTSGVRSVGVRPVPPVVSTTRAPRRDRRRDRRADRVAVGHDGRSLAGEAQPGEEVDDAADRSRRRTPRPRRGWRPRRRRRAAHGVASPRDQSPDLPPDLVTMRTSVITARLSTAFTMSITVSAGDRDRGQRLHLDAGAVGGAHGRGDLDGVVGDREVDGDRRDRERVAQRDQRRRLLGAHDPGEPGDGERVALGHAGAAQQATTSAETSTRPAATASRAVTSLPDTSTIRAAPDSSTWVSRSIGPPSELLVERQHGHLSRRRRPRSRPRAPRSARRTSARSPIMCEPWPPTGVTASRAVDDRRLPRANCRRPSGERSAWVSRARPPRAGRTGGRPISLRMRRQHELLEGDVRRHRVAGQREDRDVASSPTVPKPCGLPGCIATPPNQTVPERRERLLDHVVVAHARPRRW